MSPVRVQRRRTKGWRMPDNTVYVGRGTMWGNPYRAGEAQVRMPALDGSEWEHEGRLHKISGQKHAFYHGAPKGEPMPITWHQVEDATAEQCVQMYRETLTGEGMTHIEYRHRPTQDPLLAEVRELAGKDLACWCPLNQPCHADVLLELANA